MLRIAYLNDGFGAETFAPKLLNSRIRQPARMIAFFLIAFSH